MVDVNLIPANRLAKKQRKARLRLWAAICGTYLISLAALVLLAHTFWSNDNDPVTEELKSNKQRIEGYNSTITDLQQNLTKATAALEASKTIRSQPDWSKLLIILSNELGEEVVLQNFQLATLNKDSRETANLQELLSSSSSNVLLTERRYRLKLSGFGRTQNSVSQFVLGLEQMQIFDSVRLVNSYRQAFLNGEAIAFSIECII